MVLVSLDSLCLLRGCFCFIQFLSWIGDIWFYDLKCSSHEEAQSCSPGLFWVSICLHHVFAGNYIIEQCDCHMCSSMWVFSNNSEVHLGAVDHVQDGINNFKRKDFSTCFVGHIESVRNIWTDKGNSLCFLHLNGETWASHRASPQLAVSLPKDWISRLRAQFSRGWFLVFRPLRQCCYFPSS